MLPKDVEKILEVYIFYIKSELICESEVSFLFASSLLTFLDSDSCGIVGMHREMEDRVTGCLSYITNYLFGTRAL